MPSVMIMLYFLLFLDAIFGMRSIYPCDGLLRDVVAYDLIAIDRMDMLHGYITDHFLRPRLLVVFAHFHSYGSFAGVVRYDIMARERMRSPHPYITPSRIPI